MTSSQHASTAVLSDYEIEAESTNLVIDSQIHLFDGAAGAVAPTINQRALSEHEIIAEMDNARVRGAVLIAPRLDAATNHGSIAAAHRWPNRFGVMLKAEPDKPRQSELSAMLSDQAVLGLRVSLPLGQRWIQDRTADWIWRIAGDHDVPVMIWPPDQFRLVAMLAKRLPQLRLIIDHVGLTATDGVHQLKQKVDAIAPLADLSTVGVKVSGLTCHTEERYPFSALQECILRIVDMFGPERVFWGSDLTRLTGPYKQAVELFRTAVPFRDARDRELILGRSLARWLGWPSSPGESAGVEAMRS